MKRLLFLFPVLVLAAALVVPSAWETALADDGRGDDDRDCEEYDHVFRTRLSGKYEVPPVRTDAHGNFVSHVNAGYDTLCYLLVAVRIENVVAAHIHLGGPDENGPPVATLYGPASPGMGRHNGKLAKGCVTADDLIGPLEGESLAELILEMARGNTYVNVHTNDGEGASNTGPGDMASGEIRGQIELKGTLPPAFARLQVIHNAADPDAEMVDVYVNGERLIDDFAFRSATPFVDVPAMRFLKIGIAPPDSDPDDYGWGECDDGDDDWDDDDCDDDDDDEWDDDDDDEWDDEDDDEYAGREGRGDRSDNGDRGRGNRGRGRGDDDDDDDCDDDDDDDDCDDDDDDCEGRCRGDYIETFEVILLKDGRYVVFANGVLDPDDFAPNPDGREIALTLFAKDEAREMSMDGDLVDFFVLHGATDAPAVDVVARDVATIADDLAYGDMTDYIQVPPDSYLVDIFPGGDGTIAVGTWLADLTALGGGAAAVFASGFLDPAENMEGPAFGLFAALPDGTVIEFPMITEARLQLVHNAADPSVSMVDVYVEGDLLLDDFMFRTATPFIDVPAWTPLDVGVAPPTSASSDEAIANFEVAFMAGETYVGFANGVVEPDSFAANPDGRDIGFTVFLKDGAREAAEDPGMVEFFALHGSTDAPTVDVIARDVATLVDDAAYGDFTGYIAVPPSSYLLDITPGDDNTTIVASFEADLSGLAGASAAVFASGFLDPGANQGGPAFGLFAALPDGSVVEFPAVAVEDARLQLVHNAADPAADSVDVYVDDMLFLDDFAFRTATPFVDIAPGMHAVGIAPAASASAGDIIASFDLDLMSGETYVAVANGVVVPDSFAANPDGMEIGLTVFLKDDAREEAGDAGMTDFFILHGSTDAPAVEVRARDALLLAGSLAYGDMTDYLSVPSDRYLIDIFPAGDTLNAVGTWEADLTGLAGGAATVFASGFLDPGANQGGAAFGLFAALADGTVLELPRITGARVQLVHNSADPAADTVDVYVGDDLLLDDFMFRTATPFIDVPAWTLLEIGVAPWTSTSAGDAVATFSYVFEAGETYAGIASGVVEPDSFAANPDGRDTGLWVFVKTGAREAGIDPAQVEALVHHGSTDAPTVDIVIHESVTLVDDIAYGDMTEYAGLDATSYFLDITPGNDNATIVASFEADLTGLGGGAAIVFASGFLDPSTNQEGPAFGLFAALPDGTVLEFPPSDTEGSGGSGTGSGLTDSEVPAASALAQNYPNPFNPATTIAFSLKAAGPVSLRIYDPAGRLIRTLVDGSRTAGNHEVSWNGLDDAGRQVTSGVYFYSLAAGDFVKTRKMILLR